MRAKTIFTKKRIRFIKENRLKLSAIKIADHLGLDRTSVGRYMRANGLTPPKEVIIGFRAEAMKGRTKLTPAQDKIIKKKYLNVVPQKLADQLGVSEVCVKNRIRQLGLVIPREVIEQRVIDARIKPGNIPANKGKKQSEYMSRKSIAKTKATRFKKGHLPHNAIGFKDGDISIRQTHADKGGRSYKWIRVSLGKWQLLHIYLWEKKNGPLPKGHCLWFIDEDTMNCDLNNLELITRAENVRRNASKTRDGLSDNYIAGLLTHNDPEMRKLIKQKPEVLEIKRQQLQLNRAIYERKKQQNGK